MLRKGESVHTLGFPRPDMQGRESKFTTGVISSLSGLQDDPSTLQISTPIQPGNSGGPLFNDSGRVIGVIVAKLRATSDIAPESVNYAIKSNLLIDLLRSAKSLGVNSFALARGQGIPMRLPDIAAKAEQSIVLLASARPTSIPSRPAFESPARLKPPVENDQAAIDIDIVNWIRPTKLPVSTKYSPERKGIEFSGQVGSPVHAVANGKVVYTGNGLRGYSNLIILRHNNTYLTAYANNSKLLVKEGQEVVQGQVIAEMGSSLVFELRKKGLPVDPTTYLPM